MHKVRGHNDEDPGFPLQGLLSEPKIILFEMLGMRRAQRREEQNEHLNTQSTVELSFYIFDKKLSSDWDWDLGLGTWDLGIEWRIENRE